MGLLRPPEGDARRLGGARGVRGPRAAAVDPPVEGGGGARGAAFYLDRGLLREGRNRYLPWERLHYPVHYYYDVLVGLETLVRLGYGDDRGLRPAVELLERKRRPDGTWASDAVHPDLGRGADYGVDPGVRRFRLERVGAPSKWITLRALTVLRSR